MKTAASFHPLREPQGKPSKMMAFSWFISQLGFCIFVYLGMKNVIML
jgi:hypothetical protein